MNFHVLTLFPELIEQAAGTSILGRALQQEMIHLQAVNIRDYTENKHKKVDDYPYGGGAGMLMQAQPVYDCFCAVEQGIREAGRTSAGEGLRVIYLSPQGKTFHQGMAEELAKEEDLVFLCGHYEGIDERVLEEIVTDYVSIGDYVLTGGELPALVMMDAIARLCPGVLHNEVSADVETFYNDLLEYPQYSRPAVWKGKKVPEVLLSGDHKKIVQWRRAQSEERTRAKRPDLFRRYEKRQKLAERLLKKDRVLYRNMAESLHRGRGEIYYHGREGLMIRDQAAGLWMMEAHPDPSGEQSVSGDQKGIWVDPSIKVSSGPVHCRALVSRLPQTRDFWQLVLHQEELLEVVKDCLPVTVVTPFYRVAFHAKTAPSVPSVQSRISTLGPEWLSEIMEGYHTMPEDYIQERLEHGMIFGAFVEEELAGFMGEHQEGSLGMLYVREAYRRKGIGQILMAYAIGEQLSKGYVPYGEIAEGNEASLRLMKKLGFKISGIKGYWVELERGETAESCQWK